MSITRKIFGVGAWTGVSRVLGFARDMLIARFLGAGRGSDIFLTAFKLPNMFRDLLGEGAMSSVFIPIFSRENRDSKFASNAFSWLILVTLAITIALTILMPIIMMGMAPGFDAEKLAMTVYIGRIMIWYLVLIIAAGFLASILNAFSDFAIAAATPIITNLALIFALLVFGANLPWLAVMVLIAGILQIAILAARIRAKNFGLRLVRPHITPLIKTMGQRMSWGFLGSGFYQLNVIAGVIIASFQTGAVSYLYYADRLVQLPFAIIGIATGTVMLTKISDAMATQKMDAVYKYQNAALKNSLMLVLPAMIGLIVLAFPIVSALFVRGEFTSIDAIAVALALMILALSLPFMTTSQIYLKTIYATGDAKTPVKISAWTLGLSIFIMIAAATWFSYSNLSNFIYLSVPIGTVIGGAVRNFALKQTCRRRKIIKLYPETQVIVAIFFILSLLMGFGIYYIKHGFLYYLTLINLFLLIMIGAVIYLLPAFFYDKMVMRKRRKTL